MRLFQDIRTTWSLIKSDWNVCPYKKFDSNVGLIFSALTGLTQSFTYLFWFRLASNPNIFRIIAKIMHYRLSRAYGVYIPTTTSIGKGFIIWHPCGIVINPDAKIGNYCQIHQFLSIGNTPNGTAVIGDNVWIGPHVSIVGPVKIGDNVKIGAGTVVIRDVPKNATSVGNPNRIINK